MTAQSLLSHCKSTATSCSIGEGEACPALELTLRHMSVGEKHEVACISRFGYGPFACHGIPGEDEDIPPDTRLLQRITLHEVFEEEDNAESEGFWEQRFRIIENRKKSGNIYFKRKAFSKALVCYEKGMEAFLSHESATEEQSSDLQDRLKRLVVDCASNAAAVHLQMQDGPKAMQACTCALTYNPDSLKLLYRAAKAAYLMAEYDECERWLRDAEKIDADDASVKKLAAQVKRAKLKHAADQKKMGKKLVSKVSWSQSKPEPTWIQQKFSTVKEYLRPFARGLAQGVVLSLIMAAVMAMLVKSPQQAEKEKAGQVG